MVSMRHAGVAQILCEKHQPLVAKKIAIAALIFFGNLPPRFSFVSPGKVSGSAFQRQAPWSVAVYLTNQYLYSWLAGGPVFSDKSLPRRSAVFSCS